VCVELLRPTYTLTTWMTSWRCPYSPAAAAAIDRYLRSAGRTAANLQQRRALAGWDRQMDTRQLHRPCCAYYTVEPISLCRSSSFWSQRRTLAAAAVWHGRQQISIDGTDRPTDGCTDGQTLARRIYAYHRKRSASTVYRRLRPRHHLHGLVSVLEPAVV